RLEEAARVLMEDPAGEPLGGALLEVAVVQLLLQDLGDDASAECERAVTLLWVPAVTAEHQSRLVREDLDRLVQGELAVRRAEHERPGHVEPDVAVRERHSEQVA